MSTIMGYTMMETSATMSILTMQVSMRKAVFEARSVPTYKTIRINYTTCTKIQKPRIPRNILFQCV